MIVTENALYAIHQLNGGTETILGVPLVTDDYTLFLNEGKSYLEQAGHLLENEPSEDLITAGVVLECFTKAEHHMMIGNLIIGFSQNAVGTSVLVACEDGTYRIEMLLKGHLLIGIMAQARFLQRDDSDVEASELKYANMDVILEGLSDQESTMLVYYHKGVCLYQKLLIDFYDRVLEYDLTSEKGRSISALEIKKQIVEWMKVGQEYESGNQNRL